MSISFDFSGKRILVTGASQGIGRELCIELASSRAEVYALARNEEALKELCKQCPSITSIACDVTRSSSELSSILRPFLPFHCLVNNAGVAHLERFGEITGESFERTLSVNLTAPILISQIVADSMIKHNIRGSIVMMSSQASLRPIENHLVYCSSKAALDMATRSMAKELGEKGIRVNAVNPTVVLTEMGKKNWSDKEKAAALLSSMSIKRFAEVSDVISSTLFLLSSASEMTTGSTLPVDGGFSTQ